MWCALHKYCLDPICSRTTLANVQILPHDKTKIINSYQQTCLPFPSQYYMYMQKHKIILHFLLCLAQHLSSSEAFYGLARCQPLKPIDLIRNCQRNGTKTLLLHSMTFDRQLQEYTKEAATGWVGLSL